MRGGFVVVVALCSQNHRIEFNELGYSTLLVRGSPAVGDTRQKRYQIWTDRAEDDARARARKGRRVRMNVGSLAD